mgnify:CR=1 FL=1
MSNVKTSFTILLLSVLVLSCNSTKLIKKDFGKNQITVHKTKCGSYEVNNNETTIGFIVKTFEIKVDRRKAITEFERKLIEKYKNKFDRDYRIYAFTKNRAGDIILMTLFLSYNQAKDIPDSWKCEFKEVQVYPKRSKWVDYNYTKNRFKVPGDPD